MTPMAAGVARKLKAVIALEGSVENERTARTLYVSPLNTWYDVAAVEGLLHRLFVEGPVWEELQ